MASQDPLGHSNAYRDHQTVNDSQHAHSHTSTHLDLNGYQAEIVEGCPPFGEQSVWGADGSQVILANGIIVPLQSLHLYLYPEIGTLLNSFDQIIGPQTTSGLPAVGRLSYDGTTGPDFTTTRFSLMSSSDLDGLASGNDPYSQQFQSGTGTGAPFSSQTTALDAAFPASDTLTGGGPALTRNGTDDSMAQERTPSVCAHELDHPMHGEKRGHSGSEYDNSEGQYPKRPRAVGSAVEVGLDGNAAEFCTSWFRKYGIFPSGEDLNALSRLTITPVEAIQNWFGQKVFQGLESDDSAYQSRQPVDVSRTKSQSSSGSMEIRSGAPGASSNSQGSMPNTASTGKRRRVKSSKGPPVRAVGTAGQKCCKPTSDLDRLKRDELRIYQCTSKCGQTFDRKDSWKKHEDLRYPQRGWLCCLCRSEEQGYATPSYRKDHFKQHFDCVHPELSMVQHENASLFTPPTAHQFPKHCGFCKDRFTTAKERKHHIADHFEKGKCMLDWRDPDTDDSGEVDSGDDPGDDPGDGHGNAPQDDPGDNSDDNSGGDPPNLPPDESRDNSGDTGPEDDNSDDQDLQDDYEAGVSPYDEHNIGRVNRTDEGGDTVTDSPQSGHGKTDVQYGEGSCQVLGQNFIRGLWQTLWSPESWEPAPCGQEAGYHHVVEAKEKALLLQSYTLAMAGALPKRGIVEKTQKTSDSLVPNRVPNWSWAGAEGASLTSLRLLGAGGFATVEELLWNDVGMKLARKTVQDCQEGHDRYREASTLQCLRHPHIIRHIASDAQGKTTSLLLMPVGDTNLADYLLEEPVDAVAQAERVNNLRRWFRCLSSALYHLHAKGFGHTDIKPANILVVRGGTPSIILADFGSAQVLHGRGMNNDPSAITPEYCAPEAFYSREAVGEAYDIWSLGCVFSEMATLIHGHNLNDMRVFMKGQPYHRNPKLAHVWLDRLAAKENRDTRMLQTIKHMLDLDPTKLVWLGPEADGAEDVIGTTEKSPAWIDITTDRSNGIQNGFDQGERSFEKTAMESENSSRKFGPGISPSTSNTIGLATNN
ncbi:hypothetical protein H2199_000102 [Coniosporium tulheliwenetii]|uniref:Uncharacterized protein n=1 Tax=Coniosporium tulheliwenetii TaxID=3383036 RepID=A0ACC2ZP44_9PEZI|nr:hypothetical protein H2199_000102 [Cladosporium sp. JES 115]